MAENCTHDCSSCSSNCGERTQPQSLLEPCNSVSSVKQVIAVVSGTGGVGKSLVTASLAAAMAKRGRKTAILDADITGPSIPHAFGIHEKATGTELGIDPAVSKGGVEIMSLNLLTQDETDPVVWRGPVIAGPVKQFWTDVVWVFQSLPVDGLIVVTSPQDLVSMIVTKAVRMAELMNIPILGLIENYSWFQCPDCGKKHAIYGESHVDEVAARHQIPVLAKLPIDPAFAAAVDAGKVEELEPNPLAEVAEKLEE